MITEIIIGVISGGVFMVCLFMFIGWVDTQWRGK
jgi:uncharacterized membrane protein